MARGGAFSAKADDPTAIEYNPAGLAKQRGTRLMIHSNFIDEDHSVQRRDFDDQGNLIAEYPEVKNSAGVFWLPFIALTSDFGLDRITFAAGVYGPNAGRFRKWPACIGVQEAKLQPDYCGPLEENYAPQRYLMIDQDLFLAYPTVGAGFRALPWLDIGAEFQMAYAFVNFDKTASAIGGGQHLGDVRAYVGSDGFLRDNFTPIVQLGLLARMSRWLPAGSGLEFGAAWRSSFTLNLEGDVDVVPSGTLAEAITITPANPHATLVIPLPWMVRGGIRYYVERGGFEVWDVELDANYEAYSTFESIDVRFDPPLGIQLGGNKPTSLPVFIDPHRWQNAASVRLGGSYNFPRVGPGALFLRAGGNFEGSTVPHEFTQTDFSGFRRIGLAGGVGYEWLGVRLSVAYEHLWFETRVVENTGLRQSDYTGSGACASDLSDCAVVANGTFKTSYNFFALGLDVHFDEVWAVATR